jgi:hypothetical protein
VELPNPTVPQELLPERRRIRSIFEGATIRRTKGFGSVVQLSFNHIKCKSKQSHEMSGARSAMLDAAALGY